MPRFLYTEGNSTLAIFICDRCRMKRPLDEAMPDANFPGLRVCQQGCADQKDPYRLAARKTEKITIQFPRPDVSVATDPNSITATGSDTNVLSTQNNTDVPSTNGNLDSLGL